MAEYNEKEVRIRNVIDTEQNWLLYNPVLLRGEIGFAIKAGNQIAYKIGDGNTAWANLPYSINTASEITAMITNLQNQIDAIVTTSASGGDVAAEVAQSRVGADGTAYQTLKQRLDAEYNALTAEQTNLKEDLIELQQGGYIADQQQIAQKISDWLEEHPEATTTVQDGSLTSVKFSESLKNSTIHHYATPQMYGAKADGETDDTAAIQQCVTENQNVFFPSGTYICGTINVPTGRKLTGQQGTIIKCNADVWINTPLDIFIKDLSIEGSENVDMITGSYAYITLVNVTATNFKNIIVISDRKSFSGYVFANRSKFVNVKEGVVKNTKTFNYAKFTECIFQDCRNVLYFPTGLRMEDICFDSCAFEGNTSEYILNFETNSYFISGLTFQGCYIETPYPIWRTANSGSINFNGCWFYAKSEYICDVRPTANEALYISIDNCILNASSTYDGLLVNAPSWYHVIVRNCQSDTRSNFDSLVSGDNVMYENVRNGYYTINKPIRTPSIKLSTDNVSEIIYADTKKAIRPVGASGQRNAYFPVIFEVENVSDLDSLSVNYGLALGFVINDNNLYYYRNGSWIALTHNAQ